VAVDAPDGLVVPNIKRADELSLKGLARRSTSGGARQGRKNHGRRISLVARFRFESGYPSNLFWRRHHRAAERGHFGEWAKSRNGSWSSTSRDRTRWRFHPVMYLALSYDHRIIDGVLGNSFLYRVAEILEKGEFEV